MLSVSIRQLLCSHFPVIGLCRRIVGPRLYAFWGSPMQAVISVTRQFTG